jgi:hypothetical protein
MKSKIMMVIFPVMFCPLAWAGDCELTITRTACPGKTKEAMAPYNDVNPTIEKKSAGSPRVCIEIAKKSCRIIRRGTLSKKDIVAKFDGVLVDGTKDICDDVPTSKAPCK